MDNIRTVSDTKRKFYGYHTRPINSIYRRFVEELLVEMHLLSVNVDFNYDPIYALGVVTSFERFMQGYKPESDKTSIFNALCQAVDGNSEKYHQEAEALINEAKGLSITEFKDKLGQEGGEGILWGTCSAIAQNPKFKYSRLFGVGLYTLLMEIDPDLVKEEEKRNQTIKEVSEALQFSSDKLQKDLDLYRSNLDKMQQLLTVIEDTLEADRKKRMSQKLEKTAEPVDEKGDKENKENEEQQQSSNG
ncbi:photosystem II biogenesis protein Psp29 [Cyanothece sp. BG0011]|uniref:photosystem II biogenesis protein Psp29 n=1 Tax=Cyanothece sp. BG0011 TaxID=2082950 RepID=UPI000D1E00B2|nr:photosystem II biogenesis protein Psp29 [Cyanothece sp. BG0011]